MNRPPRTRNSLPRMVRGGAALLLAASLFAQPAAALAEDPHWDYESHGGAAHWGDIIDPETGLPAFPDCNLREQSPVSIPSAATVRTGGLAVAYQPTRLAVLNNGHTVQVNYERGSTLAAGGKTYNLLQFHFHSPSEHEFAGRPADLEAHFVHRAADGEYAVIGVMMVAGRHNAAFQAVLDATPKSHSVTGTGLQIDAAAFMPASLAHYEYPGSFTTPPCTEGVRWRVLTTPIEVSPAQIAAFQDLDIFEHSDEFVGNARPVQPLNSRLEQQSSVTPPSTGDGGLR